MNDLKFAFRQLWKSPGFTAIAVVTLALGIGATTAIVSVGRTVHFRERPMTVVGVMPPHFSFPTAHYDEYWRPAPDPDPAADDWLANTRVIAEMRPGVK